MDAIVFILFCFKNRLQDKRNITEKACCNKYIKAKNVEYKNSF